jgi:hypothetical protein
MIKDLKKEARKQVGKLLAVRLRQISRLFETTLVSASMTLQHAWMRRYSRLAIELSRGTVLLGHASRHGTMMALTVTLLAIAVAQTVNWATAGPYGLNDASYRTG